MNLDQGSKSTKKASPKQEKPQPKANEPSLLDLETNDCKKCF